MGFYADKIFAPLMDRVLATPAVNERRKAVIGQAAGRVLEIGFGTGLNLSFYRPAVTSLTLLDSATLLPERVALRLRECRAGTVDLFTTSAEKLPFADGAFDHVVSTFTLCTIEQVAAALGEVRRVLAPAGRFLFLEHGRSPSKRLARWQDRLNPLERFCGCGCNLNRPIDRLIEQSGLTLEQLDCTPIRGLPRALMEIYQGSATR